MFLKIIKILLTVVILSGISSSVDAQNNLTFSTAENVTMSKAAKSILKQAYNSLGIDIAIIEYPALRAIRSANQGRVDGELIRMKGIEATYSDLIMIPVPLATMEGVVFTKNTNVQVSGFESLQPYKIAFRRGVKFAEFGTKGMNRTIVDSLEHAFFLLNMERVDAVISTRLTGLDVLSKLHFKGINLLDPPLTKTHFYHYLHKKHKALIPMITKSLQKMQKDGLILKTNERVTKELLHSVEIEQSR